MKAYFESPFVTLYHADCADVLADLRGISAVVTDPPYGLRFMGKAWDYDVPKAETWAAILAACLPGAHLLAACGTRTQHRMACAVEDGGWEIRDVISWLYGSGFPKSLDVSKAINREAGAERKVLGHHPRCGKEAGRYGAMTGNNALTEPSTDTSRRWSGWGTALKPACEFWTLARKPLEGTVAGNVQRFGTGGINVDGCRIGAERPTGWGGGGTHLYEGGLNRAGGDPRPCSGRWPANVIHDGSEEVLGGFPDSESTPRTPSRAHHAGKVTTFQRGSETSNHADSGSAARFFYTAKAGPGERGPDNNHPTVKPLALMKYLLKLVTPPVGMVLDPFSGSGSTLLAAKELGFKSVGIERDEKSCEITAKRLVQEVLL